MNELEIQTIRQTLQEAKEQIDKEPHLANYMLRDLPILEKLDLKELSWGMYQQGYCHKNDVKFLIEKIEKNIDNAG